MRKFIVTVASCLFAFSVSAQFDPGCPFPPRYEAIKEKHDIDDQCKREGPNSSSAAKKAESSEKNNFCATGTPVVVDVDAFKALQKKVDSKPKGFGKGEDRSELEDLITSNSGKKAGEGTLVRFTGYIVEAHYSNLGKGESVNCKHGGQEWNDIHIVIASKPTEKNMCRTVTAEMVPHFRPEVFTPDNLDMLEGIKVRFTGSMFFDSAHTPCRLLADGSFKKASPARISVWEIHPVYALDVCDAASCVADKAAGWIPFEEYVGGLMEETEEP